ncbi:superoxide dismutase family protein [Nocardioides sp. ChNu-99]|uniref:superoxide dismutase family protein n=1 Tax=Nocardioides sp. ChNu-99 TaxID=2839897 RepID=UPI002407341F|nr:superoxide dismutase family protein [Nocardioides sp. ChNu-99]
MNRTTPPIPARPRQRRSPRARALGLSAAAVLALGALAACGDESDDDNDDGTGGTIPSDTGSTEPAPVDESAGSDGSSAESGEGADGSEPEEGSEGSEGSELVVSLQDVEGTEVGTVTLSEAEEGTRVEVEVEGLTPGFHGFHVHTVGLCEPESAAPDDPGTLGAFLSAGGHLGVGESDHGDHEGDLSSLQAREDGTATLATTTDRFTMADLQDADGSAFMVHAGPDNFANVPERYAPDGPDQDTRDTGDSGDRVACGAVEAG